MHALGESISFGRFTADSLSWERWSTFSHKKYVEEAERYAKPGSVAQKKAFFEAHYKRIAAQRAAAALLEQENAAMAKNEQVNMENNGDREQGMLLFDPQSDLGSGNVTNVKVLDVKEVDRGEKERESGVVREKEPSKEKSSSVRRVKILENYAAVSATSESSETSSHIEKPLLKVVVTPKLFNFVFWTFLSENFSVLAAQIC